MKICVLFGSFNPLTNAHVTALRSAVDAIGADKGLFVATNGQYLKRKTVKIDDPFYLSEDERKTIIEKTCTTEPDLEFWGFELGGINPSRFKTLCKIQKQYPDAELYEIQGADKVHTLYKSSCAEDYLSQFSFAILHRDGIDLEAMFTEQSLLADHKDSFVFLPALEDEAEISSTDVRRRFYAGEDYSDIVPSATVEVLSHHKASDFSISFAERMQVIMKTGRFGEKTARKEVYKENLKLFLEWKDGKSHIDFGDYQAFLDGAKLYKDVYDVTDIGVRYPETLTGCINIDCVDLAEHLIAKGYNPAIERGWALRKNPFVAVPIFHFRYFSTVTPSILMSVRAAFLLKRSAIHSTLTMAVFILQTLPFSVTTGISFIPCEIQPSSAMLSPWLR